MAEAAATGAGAVTPAPLDDVMLAMDVVDTLRHRQHVVARELNEEAREADLMQRLRKIYAAQGIEVPDHILRDGVEALKKSRFVYEPPAAGLPVWLGPGLCQPLGVGPFLRHCGGGDRGGVGGLHLRGAPAGRTRGRGAADRNSARRSPPSLSALPPGSPKSPRMTQRQAGRRRCWHPARPPPRRATARMLSKRGTR